MHEESERARHEQLTRPVIGCFLAVYNELGFGFSESVYSGALEILFRDAGMDARREHSVDVIFRGTRVGSYRVGYLIEDALILELKAGHQLPPGSKAQVLTYLRISRKRLGLLLFFGPGPGIERVVL